MQLAEELHERAMELADEADRARRQGDEGRRQEFLRRAFTLECAAAELVEPARDLEPSRSVLHRSAASLALESGRTEEAARLTRIALEGNPPPEIRAELYDLLAEAESQRVTETFAAS